MRVAVDLSYVILDRTIVRMISCGHVVVMMVTVLMLSAYCWVAILGVSIHSQTTFEARPIHIDPRLKLGQGKSI